MQNPKNVIYKGIKDLNIIYQVDTYSIASFLFNDKKVYGIRWNGIESDESKGTPVSHGKPIWFILPNELVESFVKIKIKGEDK